MSDTETEAPKRGRRMPNEAPPAERGPEEEASLSIDEGEVGVTAGVYFTKAPKRDVWHAHNSEDEAVGRIWLDGTADKNTWRAKIGANEAPLTFTSSPAARAFIVGHFWNPYGTETETESV